MATFNPTFRASGIGVQQIQNPFSGLADFGETLIRLDALEKEKLRQADSDAWNQKVRARQEQEWAKADKTDAATAIANKILAEEKGYLPGAVTDAFVGSSAEQKFPLLRPNMTPEQQQQVSDWQAAWGQKMLADKAFKETELDQLNRAQQAVISAGYDVPKTLADELRLARAVYDKEKEQSRKDIDTKLASLTKEETDLRLKLGGIKDDFAKVKFKEGGKSADGKTMFGWTKAIPEMGQWDTPEMVDKIQALQLGTGYNDKQIEAAIMSALPASKDTLYGVNEEAFYDKVKDSLSKMTPSANIGGSLGASEEAAAISKRLDEIANDKYKLVGGLGLTKEDIQKNVIEASLPKTAVAEKVVEKVDGQITGKLFDGTVIPRNNEQSLTQQWNNPGAVKQADPTNSNVKWQGQIGVDSTGHAIFDTPENGTRAQLLNMNTQIKRGTTLENYINKYATENQKEYIAYVSKETGIKPNDKLEFEDIQKLAKAQTEFESGKKAFNKDVFDKAYASAFGGDIKDLFSKVNANANREIDKEATDLMKNVKGKSFLEVQQMKTKYGEDVVNRAVQKIEDKERSDSLIAHRNALLASRQPDGKYKGKTENEWIREASPKTIVGHKLGWLAPIGTAAIPATLGLGLSGTSAGIGMFP